MKRVCLIFFVLFGFIIVYSQKTQKVSVTYTYYAPETMSVEEAKRIALERSQIQAIADVFGTTVSQSSSTVISNKNGESDTQFYMTGGSDVKGEWIETIGEPVFDIKFEDHTLVVTCNVRGSIREINPEQIEISAKLLKNGTSSRHESTEFKAGDDMFLWIQSPINGYLLVFWVDYSESKAYRILPYQSDSSMLMSLTKDKKYVFFSKADADESFSSITDEFVMTCNSDVEHNDVYIIFSERKFNPNNIDGLSEGIKWLSIGSFHKWLVKTKKNQNISIQKIHLSIKQT